MINEKSNDLSIRYTYTGEFGEGGFSQVFFCMDNNLQRKVAIKTIKEKEEVARVKDEVSSLLKMRSKNVVQVYDIINLEDGIGIVMEFIEGQDLFGIDFQILHEKDKLKLLWQIASGIFDIHKSGLIHRDIKPNNMKIDSEGILKIFDFGLAKDSVVDAKTIGFKGTFYFSAPEQYSNGTVHLTNKIDLYSFSVLALFLLKNEIPDKLRSIPPLPLALEDFQGSILDNYPEIIQVLFRCASHNFMLRPDIEEVKAVIEKNILKWKHQALAVFNDKSFILNEKNKFVKISLPSVGSFELHYTGYDFRVKNTVGEVYLNNSPVTTEIIIPGACVVTLGAPNRGSARKYITFDVSNPEVML
ncbi:serine/threonine-protein kinase [Rheinheimera sp. NSM]|uniref:serine/threonine-protein kinase n=1 Tax=Rheinheimera sp. NSM TaxID=3457884 RepID=UPI004036B068